jgi:ferredoxin
MPHVVTENCTGCRFTDCVTVCPVSCFHGNGDRVYIDPVACIDCGACIPLCPVKAIYEDLDIADDRKSWIELNADKASALPVIRKKQTPLEGAEARMASLGYARSERHA